MTVIIQDKNTFRLIQCFVEFGIRSLLFQMIQSTIIEELRSLDNQDTSLHHVLDYINKLKIWMNKMH